MASPMQHQPLDDTERVSPLVSTPPATAKSATPRGGYLPSDPDASQSDDSSTPHVDLQRLLDSLGVANTAPAPPLDAPLTAQTADDSDQAPPKRTNNITVSFLPRSVDSRKLARAYAAYGRIVCAMVMLDTHSGRSRGFGFVWYEEEADAEAAVAATHDATAADVFPELKNTDCPWQNRQLRVFVSARDGALADTPQLLVTNWPAELDEAAVRSAMGACGPVDSVELGTVSALRKHPVRAVIVTFLDAATARAAVSNFHGVRIATIHGEEVELPIPLVTKLGAGFQAPQAASQRGAILDSVDRKLPTATPRGSMDAAVASDPSEIDSSMAASTVSSHIAPMRRESTSSRSTHEHVRHFAPTAPTPATAVAPRVPPPCVPSYAPPYAATAHCVFVPPPPPHHASYHAAAASMMAAPHHVLAAPHVAYPMQTYPPTTTYAVPVPPLPYHTAPAVHATQPGYATALPPGACYPPPAMPRWVA